MQIQEAGYGNGENVAQDRRGFCPGDDPGIVEWTPQWYAKLLDPQGWENVLELYARTAKLAVALIDADGRLVGTCHNPQPIWSLARGARPDSAGLCFFCTEIKPRCSAVVDALRTRSLTLVHDQAGFAHVALPLTLGQRHLGTLLAGQVLDRYPDSLALQRVAADFGLAPQELWRLARSQVPVSRASLTVYGELLWVLGQTFLQDRYYALLHAQMDASLREAKEVAEKATHLKSAFLAAMSHEIRTPMNAILGMAELLSETQLSSDQTKYVNIFRNAGATLLTLINDILDLSKIEAGHFILETIPFNLQEVCDRVIDLVREKATAKGLALNERVESEIPITLLGDPTRLQQVLLNLLGNAIKFTERGSISLTVRPQLSGEVTCVHFEVSDTGIGIPTDKLSTIFEDFQQVDPSTTRKYGGTGLGLSITKRIVELLGGVITVESTPGTGSRFRFSATFTAAELLNSVPATALRDLQGARVLIVDDNATNWMIFREMLQSWGLRVATVTSAGQALTELTEASRTGSPFSIALLDANMPDIGGFEMANQMRTVAPHLPIVMLTSDNQSGDAIKRQLQGISHYLVKPAPHADLLKTICGVLQEKRINEARTLADASNTLVHSSKLAGLRILLAEDSTDNSFLIEVYLKDSGHQLTVVENGREAVDLFQQQAFDLILMDVQMAVMDGLTATRLIREWERQENRHPTPILALTANALDTDVTEALTAGCDKHLSKPLSKRALLSGIQEYAAGGRKAVQSQDNIFENEEFVQSGPSLDP